ncbi:MAG: glycosyltransferase family 4 protein [Blautia sp.]
MSKKTICLVTKNMSVAGGAQRVTSLMAKELSAYYNVIVVSAMTDTEGKIAYDFPDNVKVIRATKGIKNATKAVLPAAKKIRKILKDQNVEVIFSVGAGAYLFVYAFSVFTGQKRVLCEHSSLANRIDIRTAQKFYEWLGAKTAHQVITLTKKDALHYERKFHIKNVKNIYNWLDLEYVQQSLEYDRTSKKILTVGRISRVKGFDMLLDVAEKVLSAHPDWEWHIYGDGPLLPEIRQEAEKRHLNRQLLFKGQCPNMYEKYGDYSFYVMTSYHEGLPMVLLEAQANYLPIISFDCETGPGEIITDSVNGYLIPAYDKNVMCEKITCLMENEALRSNMSMHSQDTLERFDKETIVKIWIDLIERLLNARDF